ncbi:MAG: N-methyl-L-tryptophan oxidase [Thaumarchaeota archaeon]|nr:N-methyl-L-tryptophan oxidase [Nitrososphaerota archaeon]
MQEARLSVRRCDALVIGCGVMGSSVSYNLASRGLRVVNVERFRVNHELGSSHGRTRIIRLAYYEDERYVPMLRRAFEAWREVERKSGAQLLRMTGGLMMGREEGELVGGVLRTARAHGLEHHVLSAREAEERFEAFTLSEEFVAVHEESAGMLFAEESVRAFVGLAREAGCDFVQSAQVTGWKAGPEGVEVEAGGERFLADRVVSCAGPWTGQLFPGVLPLKCERQVPLWFSSLGDGAFGPDRMPVFIMEEEPGRFFYGLPEVGHGVKVARTHEGDIVEPDRVNREVASEDTAPVEAFVARRLKKLGREPIASTTCLYSNTPDFNFAIGPHPKEGRVLVVSACSGHGFKFASVIGEIVSDMVTGKKNEFDVSWLGPERFNQKPNPG